MTGNTEFETKAMQTLQTFADSASQIPAAHTYFMMALDFAIGPSSEVVVVGDLGKDDTKNMLNVLRRKFIPNKVVLFRATQTEHPEIVRYAEFTRDLSSKEGKATAYVCHNYQCDLPATCKEEMLRLLDATP